MAWGQLLINIGEEQKLISTCISALSGYYPKCRVGEPRPNGMGPALSGPAK